MQLLCALSGRAIAYDAHFPDCNAVMARFRRAIHEFLAAAMSAHCSIGV
jgi:hypothetical protein